MTLELTPAEYNNLTNLLSGFNKRRQSHPLTTSSEREKNILRMVEAHESNMEIKRTLKTSYVVINRIKKENGLWGV